MNYASLPWNFEAFRRFLAYDVVQQAAATLCLFDGQPMFTDAALMEEFSRMLTERSGLEWLPSRQASEGVLFNIEGNVFRNKARIFTSFYVIDPLAFKQHVLKVTPFGKALGLGFVKEREFYWQICSRYQYPHPAYDDNWDQWSAAGISLKPLVYLLQILVEMYKIDSIGEISIAEVAKYAHPQPFHKRAKDVAQMIIQGRRDRDTGGPTRSDQVHRKIGDMLGFLCISKLCFYQDERIRLNLLGEHDVEKTVFWQRRLQQDVLLELGRLLQAVEEV